LIDFAGEKEPRLALLVWGMVFEKLLSIKNKNH